MNAINPAPKVRIGLGTILSTLTALGGGYATVASAANTSISSYGTARWGAITTLVVIAIHGFRSWQANGHLKNVRFYQQLVDGENRYVAPYLQEAVAVADRLAPAIATAVPSLAPEIQAAEAVVAELAPSTVAPAVAGSPDAPAPTTP